MAGHTPISFGALPPAVPLVKEGRLRALAITSGARTRALPDVPTIADAGYPDVAADIWTAVLAPAGTSPEIVSQLRDHISAIVSTPDVSERLASLGFSPLALSPEESAGHIRAEHLKWAKVIELAGIKAE